MFRPILVPVDQHPACKHAVQHAFDLCRALGGLVTLLHVVEGNRAADRRAAQAHLDVLACGARRPPMRAVLSVQHHDVARVVSTFAQPQGADLIVLGSWGHGGLVDAAQRALALSLARSSGRPVQLASGAGHAHGTAPLRPSTIRRLKGSAPCAPERGCPSRPRVRTLAGATGLSAQTVDRPEGSPPEAGGTEPPGRGGCS